MNGHLFTFLLAFFGVVHGGSTKMRYGLRLLFRTLRYCNASLRWPHFVSFFFFYSFFFLICWVQQDIVLLILLSIPFILTDYYCHECFDSLLQAEGEKRSRNGSFPHSGALLQGCRCGLFTAFGCCMVHLGVFGVHKPAHHLFSLLLLTRCVKSLSKY